MARTFNRQPITIDTPDDEDIKHYFYNNYEFKGIIDDKNYLQVDQYSFEDCNNVYVDENGLLRSRPSLKYEKIIITLNDEETTLANIVDMEVFGNVTVYKSILDDKYYLTFVNSNNDKCLQEEVNENLKLLLVNHKIFVFQEDSFNYYDMDTDEYLSAEKFVYVPTTKVYANGIESSEEKVETINYLTTSEITSYLYDNPLNYNFDQFIGKNLTLIIDKQEYTITFEEGSNLTFVEKYCKVDGNFLSNNVILGVNGENIPLVEVGSNGVCLFTTYTFNNSTKKVSEWNSNYSVDGIVFNKLYLPSDIIAPPKLSRNGLFAIVFKSDGPYIKSIISNTGDSSGTLGTTYSSWTNLCALANNASTTYDIWNLNLNEETYHTIDYKSRYYNNTISVNGYFIDDTNYSFVYGDNINYLDSTHTPFYTYLNMICVKCINNELERFTIYDTKAIDELSEEKEFSTKIEEATNASFDDKVIYYTANNELISYDNTNNTFTPIENCGIVTMSDISIATSIDATTATITFTVKYTINATLKYDYGKDVLKNRTITITSDAVSFTKTFDISETPATYEIEDSYTTSVTRDDDTTYTVKLFTLNIVVSANDNDTTYKWTVTPANYLRFVGAQSDYTDAIYEYPIDILNSTRLKTVVGQIYGQTSAYMPNVYMDDTTYDTLIDFVSYIYYSTTEIYNAICLISNSTLTYLEYDNVSINIYQADSRSPIRNAISATSTYSKVYATSDKYIMKIYEISTEETDKINVETTELLTTTEDKSLTTCFKLSLPSNYILSDDYLFTITASEYKAIKLLFELYPIAYYYYYSNYANGIYGINKDGDTYYLYTNKEDFNFELQEETNGAINYLLYDCVAELTNYYFSKDKTLYISSAKYDDDNNFMWYLPKINNQVFDYPITNLHTVSSTEVAIFLEDSVYYVSYDTDNSAYTYYKTKLQVGCNKGSDVITTFDGKYIIFVTKRGLVAMSYQEFIQSTEQSLTYISDNIYSLFFNYCYDENSTNEIKLFKYSYWIFVYKKDSSKGFLLDLRNNTWWILTGIDNSIKFVEKNNKIKYLCKNKVFNLDKEDTNYFDYDGSKNYKIDWRVLSQKLYLNALNYYKHIINITFSSVHDLKALQNNAIVIEDLFMNLKTNNYRKKVNGNVDDENDEGLSIHHNVTMAKTYVQRLNFSKVNEFQYELTCDTEKAINIPLSLSGITVKYKIGTEVR